jgi:hypothetical protein
MLNYEEFIFKLSSLATSFNDDTYKSLEMIKHFQIFFDNIISLENKYIIQCDNVKLQQLLSEADIVKRKLFEMEENEGEILNKISIKYPLFYRELEFGMTDECIEKYLNILYAMIYIIENNSVMLNVYKEMGLCAIELISSLTSEFLSVKDNTFNPELDNLMNEMII